MRATLGRNPYTTCYCLRRTNMAKFRVDVELIAYRTLTIEAPSAKAVKDFFDNDDDYVTSSIVENCGAFEDGLGVREVRDIKPVKQGSYDDCDPDFYVTADGESADEPESCDLHEEDEE